MSLDENPFYERMKKMPPAIAVCAGIGGALGAIPGAVLASHIPSIRAMVFVLMLFVSGGFVLGVFAGVTLDTLVFKPRRDKEERRQKRLRRRMEDKARRAGL